mgnify:CR=1 FL=1
MITDTEEGIGLSCTCSTCSHTVVLAKLKSDGVIEFHKRYHGEHHILRIPVKPLLALLSASSNASFAAADD